MSQPETEITSSKNMTEVRTLSELSLLLKQEMGIEGLETANVGKIQNILASYMPSKNDWEKYAMVSEGKYTRNLVDDGNGKFNLMVLCWDKGVSSAIHDHSNSHCLVKVLSGNLVESLYDWPKSQEEHHPLSVKSELTFNSNQVSYMHGIFYD
jgi:cysteine dioxygenase